MGNALNRPKAHLSGTRRRRFHARIPTVCTALLFHNAKNRGKRTHLRQFCAAPSIQKRIIFPIGVQTKRKIRIGVVGQKVQTFPAQPQIIDIGKDPVCGNKIIRLAVLADNLRLLHRKAADALGYKTVVFQLQMGIDAVGMGPAGN